MPNYPSMVVMENYKGKFYLFEKINSIKVHRAFIFVRKSKSLVLRLLNYFSFVLTSLFVGLFKIGNQDFILCESPPLFLGITALILAREKKAKLIFNVSDLWPESAEKLGLVTNKFLLNISTKLEEHIYKNSFLITGQTNGIINNIKIRFPSKNTYWLKNGVDINLFQNYNFDNHWKIKNGFSKDDFLILYAGIFGYAQGLEVILNAAEKVKNNSDIKFIFVGDGPEKEKLINLKNKISLNNVSFFDPVKKNEMPSIIASVNASIIPLKKLDLFKGAIPSKIFEILASKKPILLGVEGEAEEIFISGGNCGLSFQPEDPEDLARKILVLYQSPALAEGLGINGHNFVNQNFNRDKIAEEFWDYLNQNGINS